MTSLSIKRIIKDVSYIMKEPLINDKIYIWQDPQNIYQVKIMMIGDSDTPYEYGIFYFFLEFPENYPFNPPIMKFITSNGKTRFNPNLYVSGKICLSLLNTWSGPKWTACNNLKSLLLSIKSMILGVRYPLENEPTYDITPEVKKQIDLAQNTLNDIYLKYNAILEYQTILHTIVEQYVNIPIGMEIFKDVVESYITNNINNIRNKIIKNLELYNKCFVSISYSQQSQLLDYDYLLDTFDKVFQNKFYHCLNVQNNFYHCYNVQNQIINRNNKYKDNDEIKSLNTLNFNLKETLTNDLEVKDNINIVLEETLTNDLKVSDNINIVLEETLTNDLKVSDNINIVLEETLTNDLKVSDNINIVLEETLTNVLDVSNLNVEDNEKNCNEMETDFNISKSNINQEVVHKNEFILTENFLENSKIKNEIIDSQMDTDSETSLEEQQTKKQGLKKKCPNKNAKNYDVGTILVSENDNRKYIVKSYNKKKFSNGSMVIYDVKRWILFR
jgi:ubiquitin-conjugating enzyme E2 Z